MKFREKFNLCTMIDEYQWHNNSLMVLVPLHSLEDFVRLSTKYLNEDFYAEHHGGIKMTVDDVHAWVEEFQNILEWMGCSQEEIEEMFEKEF